MFIPSLQKRLREDGMPVKLIITDLDGTLLGEDHQTISERNKKALERAAAQGITIALGSGRTYGVLKNVLKQTDAIDYVMMSNGAALMNNRTGEQTQIGEIPYTLWMPLYELLKAHKAVFEVYYEGYSYIERESRERFINDWIPQSFLDELTENMIVVDSLPEFLEGEPLEKFDVIQTPKEHIEALSRELSRRAEFAVTSSLPGNMEINLKGVDKGEGTRGLCRLLGITPQEVMAFGDANNDLAMMQTAGYSFAMENASREIKEAAGYMTASNREDGVAAGIEKLLNGEI